MQSKIIESGCENVECRKCPTCIKDVAIEIDRINQAERDMYAREDKKWRLLLGRAIDQKK